MSRTLERTRKELEIIQNADDDLVAMGSEFITTYPISVSVTSLTSILEQMEKNALPKV